MQRDDHLPLNEIYSTPEALHEEVEKILDLALYKVPENTPIKLRFITPVSVEKWLVDDSYNDYRLTTPEEHADGMEYITVSYCWKHTQSMEGRPPLPHYHISDWSKAGEPIPIGCPTLVFHRAMLFARSRKCAFVWIDQECIDQTDPTDIQAHLKIMHRVYKESKWTVAPLSHPITDRRSLEQLITYLYHDCKYNKDVTNRESSEWPPGSERVKAATELLTSIAQDVWFRRTWAFQEKRFASALFLLVPIEVSSKISDDVHLHMIGADFCFDATYFNDLCGRHMADMLHVCSLNKDEKWTFLGSHRFYENFATSRDYTSNRTWWGCLAIFRTMQDCDNQMVADRIAIFGHICRFRNRLASCMLDSGNYGLSACILALLLGNINITRDGRLGLVEKTWAGLEESSKVKTYAPNITAWMLVLFDKQYHSPEIAFLRY